MDWRVMDCDAGFLHTFKRNYSGVGVFSSRMLCLFLIVMAYHRKEVFGVMAHHSDRILAAIFVNLHSPPLALGGDGWCSYQVRARPGQTLNISIKIKYLAQYIAMIRR